MRRMISGVFLEALSVDIVCKNDKTYMCLARSVVKHAKEFSAERKQHWAEEKPNLDIASLLEDADFAGDMEDSKSMSGGVLFIFGSQTFVPVGCSCKNRLLFLTVVLKQKSFPWTLVCVLMEFLH